MANVDPKEETPIPSNWYHMTWTRWPISDLLTEHLASLQREPPVPPGTPDPYTPGGR